jgi:hypothetical protein
VVRCRQTVEPLARARGLTLRTEPLLEPDGDVAELQRRLLTPDLDGAVLCTHGEFLDRLLDRWSRSGRVRFSGHRAVGTAKGSAWVVEDLGGAAATARYLTPVTRPHAPGSPA